VTPSCAPRTPSSGVGLVGVLVGSSQNHLPEIVDLDAMTRVWSWRDRWFGWRCILSCLPADVSRKLLTIRQGAFEPCDGFAEGSSFVGIGWRGQQRVASARHPKPLDAWDAIRDSNTERQRLHGAARLHLVMASTRRSPVGSSGPSQP